MGKSKDAQATHDAGANAAAADAGNIPSRARQGINDVAKRLQITYVKPIHLQHMGRFDIVAGHIRKERGKFQEQCEFEIELLDGENAGAQALLTLTANPQRRRLVDILRSSGSVGPVVLRPVGKAQEGQSQAWGFVDPDSPEGQGVIAGE
jgi:hypothetical protein